MRPWPAVVVVVVLAGGACSSNSRVTVPSADPSTPPPAACDLSEAFPLEAYVEKPYFEWLKIGSDVEVEEMGTGHEPYPDAMVVDLGAATIVRDAVTLRGEALPRLSRVFFDQSRLQEFRSASSTTRYVAAAISPPSSPPARAQANLVLAATADGAIESPDACLETAYADRFSAAAIAQSGDDRTEESAIVHAILDPAAEPGVIAALSGKKIPPN